jgi:recombinational DNA repair protein RecR
MLEFARERITEYSPHDCFAMDIASVHDGEYYIIECGCLNSVGFYHADIKKLVKKISEYVCTKKELVN